MSTLKDFHGTDFLQQHSEFKKLHRFIQEEIPQVIKVNYPISEKLLSDSKAAIIEEVERIKHCMSDAKIHLNNNFSIETYVQAHQRSLIQMTGALLQHVQAEHIIQSTETQGAEVFCQYLYQVLQDLMRFMENQFPKYFDPNVWIPADYRQILIHSFRSKLPSVQKNLAQHNIDPYLIKIVLQPATDFITSQENSDITYQKVIYLKELIDRLIAFTPICPTDCHETFHELLLAMSFNAVEYFNYRVRAIKANVSAYAPITEH